MFITVDCYYETYLKGKEKEEVEEEIDRLKRDIKELETAKEEDFAEIKKLFPDFPTPKDQIAIKQEYLQKALEVYNNL